MEATTRGDHSSSVRSTMAETLVMEEVWARWNNYVTKNEADLEVLRQKHDVELQQLRAKNATC